MRICFYLMLALLLALPGCGGGGDEKPPPVSPGQAAATLDSVRITEGNPSQAAGLSSTLRLEGIYSDGTSKEITEGIEWQSSKNEIATVADAVVTCLSPGKAVITATFQDHSDTVTFTVTDAVLRSVRIPEEDLSQAVGLSRTLTLEGIFSDGTSQRITEDVAWQSSDMDIARVVDGVVTCRAPGDVEITAIFQGQSDTVTFSVTGVILQSVIIPEEQLSQAAGLSQTLTLEGNYSDGTTQEITEEIDWQSSNPGVATIADGVVTCITPGDTIITATFQGLSDTVTFNVADAHLEDINIIPSDWELNPYIQKQYTAEGHYSDGETRPITDIVLWSSSDPSIADVSSTEGEKGLVTANRAGRVIIYAEREGMTAEATLAIKDTAPQELAVDLMNPEYPINYSFPFTAKCLFSDGSYGDVTKQANWGSSNFEVASVNNADRKGWVLSSDVHGITEVTATWGAGNEEFTRSTIVTVKDPIDLELYLERPEFEDWLLYPLPEICDGDYCIENRSPEANDEIYVHKRFRLEANTDVTLINIRAEAVQESRYVNTEAWFNWSEGFEPNADGRLELRAGDVLYFTLESNRPEAWNTAKLQWSFGIDGKEGIDGKQFLMTIYLKPL